MNRQEWIAKGRHTNEYRRCVNNALKQWKIENNITERCVVHHKDDTEETYKYNTEHYERWGCNEDGTFEYGKYVIFMTLSEHSHYHNAGKTVSKETCVKISAATQDERNPMYGKHHSEETRAKMSLNHADISGKKNPMYGKHHSEETCAKMSAAKQGEKNPNYGKKFDGEHRAKISAAIQSEKVLYVTYKNNGGILKWSAFRKALKNGEITFEMQPVTVYTKEVTNDHTNNAS